MQAAEAARAARGQARLEARADASRRGLRGRPEAKLGSRHERMRKGSQGAGQQAELARAQGSKNRRSLAGRARLAGGERHMIEPWPSPGREATGQAGRQASERTSNPAGTERDPPAERTTGGEGGMAVPSSQWTEPKACPAAGGNKLNGAPNQPGSAHRKADHGAGGGASARKRAAGDGGRAQPSARDTRSRQPAAASGVEPAHAVGNQQSAENQQLDAARTPQAMEGADRAIGESNSKNRSTHSDAPGF
jgi:hypothetical protein